MNSARMKARNARYLIILFISHDLRVVRHISHRVAVMYLGKIVELADTEALFEHPAHPYTDILLRAEPPLDPRLRNTETAISGELPSPIRLPPDCHFFSHVTTQSSRNGLLLAAFGTTVPEARSALGHIEKKAAERFPCMEIRWAYSSRIVRGLLAEEGIIVDSLQLQTVHHFPLQVNFERPDTRSPEGQQTDRQNSSIFYASKYYLTSL